MPLLRKKNTSDNTGITETKLFSFLVPVAFLKGNRLKQNCLKC